MAQHRTPLPDEIKELIRLIRQGRLFEVEAWLKAGRPYQLPDGNYATTPLRAAIATGFHSMVELLLRHDSAQDDLDYIVYQALLERRLDLIELLVSFGADPRSIRYEDVASSSNPLILKYFEDQGVNLTEGNPLANSFQYKNRAALGTYMRYRDKNPDLKYQANMALRYHAKHNSLKWVSLLLWAGADPRAVVPDMENQPPEEWMGTALADAIQYGHLEIVRKIGVDLKKDDPTALLNEYAITPNPEIVTMLLDLGANPMSTGETSAMGNYMTSLEWSLDRQFSSYGKKDKVLTILTLLASRGGRWKPHESYPWRYLRTTLGRIEPYEAASILSRLVKANVFEVEDFKKLMNTPKMKGILKSGAPDTVFLRKFAGLKEPKDKSDTRSPRAKPDFRSAIRG